jgi:hypothetical protein
MKDCRELAKRLVAHFRFLPGEEPPTVDDFCAREGIGFGDFEELCREPEFMTAMKEARRRYLDTLTAGALLKKYDPSFVKHLLELEARREVEGSQGKFEVEIRVVE